MGSFWSKFKRRCGERGSDHNNGK